MPKQTKTGLLKKGALLFIICFVINAIFVVFGIGGLVRELSRLGALIGLLLVIIGFIIWLVSLFRKE